MGLQLQGLNELTGKGTQNSTWHVANLPQTLAITTVDLWNLGAFSGQGCQLPTLVGPVHPALRGLPQQAACWAG